MFKEKDKRKQELIGEAVEELTTMSQEEIRRVLDVTRGMQMAKELYDKRSGPKKHIAV